ncbi:MAG: SpoIIE family protein phosphatase [Acidobacteria bacterium]|nr:SpoIIE family protein phosphatase [Acidobacteriota bacterium]
MMTRILVVEDEPDIALGLEQDLRLDGYDVEVLTDGQSAVERAATASFDLILLDVMLPSKDGFTVCRELRRAGSHTPIIVLTARDQEADKVQGLELGADDYVTKPFSPTELRARIRSILRHRKEWLGDGDRFDRELRTAAEVQHRLFPQTRPPTTTLDYVGYCQPALRVGGDYYDYLELPDDRLGLVVADVSGKGVSAALVMASLHGCIRSNAVRYGERCDQVMKMANALLHEATDACRYATVFYGVYSAPTRELLYVNAGHPAPIVARREEVLNLESDCPPIGLFDGLVPQVRRVQLQAGDRVLIFSDGLSEAMNSASEEFGTARATRVLQESAGASAADLRDALLAALRLHADGHPQSDDVTFITGVVR